MIRNKDQQELWNGQKLSSCNLQSGETVFLGLKGMILQTQSCFVTYQQFLLTYEIDACFCYRNKRHIRVLYDGFKLSSG